MIERSIVLLVMLLLCGCASVHGPWPVFEEHAFIAPPAEIGSNPEVSKIAFGSCVREDKPQPIWRAVLASEPELFVFLGDNIYGDSDDPAVLAAKYERLRASPGFRAVRAAMPVAATWDDHDYGQNDIGAEYVSKSASRRLMLDFWQAPADSARRTQDGGIFASYLFGEPGRRVQLILLDLRWNRTPLTGVADEAQWKAEREPLNMGPYSANEDPNAGLVGDAQWQWLEDMLDTPANVRIVGTSIQALADFTGWESWANYPRDRQRLIETLGNQRDSQVLLISGDTHWSEISRYEAESVSLLEVTSSGLTEEWKKVSPNRHRVGEPYSKANFGLIEIDWSRKPPAVTVSIVSVDGEYRLTSQL